MKSDRLAYLALTLAALFWSGNFIAGRALRDDIDPFMLNTLRWAICLALFLPLIGRDMVRHRRVIMREWPLIVALGATGIAAFHTFVYLALLSTTAINALLIVSLLPATILVGAVLTGASRPARIQWLGALVSMVGAGILVTRGSLQVLVELQFNRGDVWMLGAIVAWTAYSLLLRKRPADLSLDASLGASIAAGLALMIPFTAMFSTSTGLGFSTSAWGAIFYIAVFASLISFRFWSFGVDQIGPERSGQFVNLMPIFGPVLAIGIPGETLAAPQIAGAVFVLAGILMVNRKPKHSAVSPNR